MDEKQQRLNAIAAPLLAWYDVHKRTLPWRGTRDPYRVWVSEIMLQQTRVAAVIPYYERWMVELPDVAALAYAEEERLMKLWQGLGYYSRARNLQRAARTILSDYGGVFPRTYEELIRLSGVGDYTAGAIASIAFDQCVPAVDGNALRIVARVADIREDIMDPKVRRTFRTMVAEAMPKERPGAYNQALMDLGATVCLPNGEPDCARCPVSHLCAAHAGGVEELLPLRRKKAKRRIESMTVYLMLREGKVALRKRPEEGLLAGLWEFPHVSGALEDAEAGWPVEAWGLKTVDWRQKLQAKHIFTHVEWHMTGYLLDVRGEAPDFFWADAEALEQLAVPSAFGKFLSEVRRCLGGGPMTEQEG